MFVHFEVCTDEQLRAAFVELGALERAVHAQRLVVLALRDARDAFKEDGAVDAAGWVAASDGCFRISAVDLVEQARGLRPLPAVAAMAAMGRLCADQLGQLVRLATPETDQAWAEGGPGLTALQLRRVVAAPRRIRLDVADEQHRRRGLSWWTDHGRGMVRLLGRLEPDAGAIVAKTLEEAAERAGPGPNGCWEAFESRCADALVETALGGPVDTRVPAEIVHATVDAPQPRGPRRAHPR